ncbi:MAG: hypothetical protein HY813_02365 [Candidatus Portnoybacteria bacterium]|nr:hypothetical protein [Candidatus Portnoybacteria bacterium]
MQNDFEKIKLQKNHRVEDKEFSSEVWDLIDRADAHDPNVEMVLQHETKSVEVGPADAQKTLLTCYLGGCNGIFIFTERKDGLRNAILAHHSELKTPFAIGEIRKELRLQPERKEAVIKQAIIMVPGIRAWDPAAEKEVLRVAETKFADEIVKAIRLELGADVDIKIEPYPEERKDNEKDFGVFVAHIPPAGERTAGYRTWFSSGEFGLKEVEK